MEYSIKYCFLCMQRWIYDYLGLCISAPIWEQTFLRMRQKEGSSETHVWALRFPRCQDLPSSLRDYEFDGEDATRDICL